METNEIIAIVDQLTSPDLMSKREALSFLEKIISDLEDIRDALEMEIEVEEED